LRYIKKQGFIFCLIVLSVTFLTTLQVIRDFGTDVLRLTSIEIVFLTGMIAGGLVISAWGGFKNRIYTMALSCLMRN
jgi:DHA3 family macrolide efflux protein-like MFS transporter